jgi:hypothetical protein
MVVVIPAHVMDMARAVWGDGTDADFVSDDLWTSHVNFVMTLLLSRDLSREDKVAKLSGVPVHHVLDIFLVWRKPVPSWKLMDLAPHTVDSRAMYLALNGGPDMLPVVKYILDEHAAKVYAAKVYDDDEQDDARGFWILRHALAMSHHFPNDNREVIDGLLDIDPGLLNGVTPTCAASYNNTYVMELTWPSDGEYDDVWNECMAAAVENGSFESADWLMKKTQWRMPDHSVIFDWIMDAVHTKLPGTVPIITLLLEMYGQSALEQGYLKSYEEHCSGVDVGHVELERRKQEFLRDQLKAICNALLRELDVEFKNLQSWRNIDKVHRQRTLRLIATMSPDVDDLEQLIRVSDGEPCAVDAAIRAGCKVELLRVLDIALAQSTAGTADRLLQTPCTDAAMLAGVLRKLSSCASCCCSLYFRVVATNMKLMTEELWALVPRRETPSMLLALPAAVEHGTNRDVSNVMKRVIAQHREMATYQLWALSRSVQNPLPNHIALKIVALNVPPM